MPYRITFPTGEIAEFADDAPLELIEGVKSAYNRFGLGHLLDNMIGLRMSASSGGWSNANHFVGGNIKISSSSESGVTGSRYILGMATGGPGADPGGPVGNGNTFDGIALEGNYPEVGVEITSTFNVFAGCRFESSAPLRFTGDKLVGDRFESLRKLIGDAFIAVELPSQSKKDHSVLTEQRDEPSVQRVIEFFNEKLK
jgi:hypothetical protein